MQTANTLFQAPKWPPRILSTTDRTTQILALKALAIGSSANTSSDDTWNASGTAPEPFSKIHQNWIPEPFRKTHQKFIPETLRYTCGHSDQREVNSRTATHLLLIPPIQKMAMLDKFRLLLKF